MTPAQYVAAARDLVILGAIGLLLWWVYRGGENAVKAGDMKALQAQVERQAQIVGAWHEESTNANAELSKAVAAINAAPPVIHDWAVQPAGLRQPSCPQPAVLPATPAKTGDLATSAGGTEPGSGEAAAADRRDFAVQEFKRKWEIALAGCRALDAQWPTTP